VTSYSAAGYSTVAACPVCAAPLVNGSASARRAEPVLRRSFPARPGSAAEARRAVVAFAMASVARDTLVLLASELVTNAVRHAGPAAHDPAAMDNAIDLVLELGAGEMRMSVHDDGPGFVPPKMNGDRREGGRGLMLVDSLCKDWGVQTEGEGCTVWCTIEAAAA
jgi:anti-sigma regulatory factor (Ser/Thr protein kinase)